MTSDRTLQRMVGGTQIGVVGLAVAEVLGTELGVALVLVGATLTAFAWASEYTA